MKIARIDERTERITDESKHVYSSSKVQRQSIALVSILFFVLSFIFFSQ